MNGKEFGIERYIDLAKEQSKAKGPTGLPGQQSFGPSILHVDRTIYSINAGEEFTTSVYTIIGGLIGSNDILHIEWWSVGTSGLATATIKIYWNDTVIETLNPDNDAEFFTTTILEPNIPNTPTDMLITTFGPDSLTGRTAKWSQTIMPNWRADGGTIKVTITSTVPRADGMVVRIIRIRQ